MLKVGLCYLQGCFMERFAYKSCSLRLQHLEKLSINHNLLKDIPKELCVLQNLQELHLGNNKLETLPEQIGYLTNLKELHIYRNNLIGLPEVSKVSLT